MVCSTFKIYFVQRTSLWADLPKANTNWRSTKHAYFALQNFREDLAKFKIDLVNIQGDETPADRYNFTIEVQDAGGQNNAVERTFVVDFGVVVEDFTTYRLGQQKFQFSTTTFEAL